MDAHRLRVLRWIAVIVPAICLALLTYVAHFHLAAILSPVAIVGLTVSVLTVGAFIFSRFLFSQIEKSEQALYRRNRELAALHAVSEALGHPLKLEAILSQALEKVIEIVKAKGVRLFLLDEANGNFVQVAVQGIGSESDARRRGWPEGVELPKQVVAADQAIILQTPISPEDHPPLTNSSDLPVGDDLAYLCVPLQAQGRVLGVLVVIQRHAGSTRDDLRLLTAVGNQLGLAISNARQYELIQRLVITDDLTGAHNRRYLNDRLARELERCRRYQHTLALIMLDLDQFKSYNDLFGHLAGDEVLRQLVEIIQHNIRAVDMVARYGGDEFCILLPEADADQAGQVAKKIQAAIAAHVFPHGRLTASLGLVYGRIMKNLAADDLIAQADEALYTAKRAGRNRTVCLRLKEPESYSSTAIRADSLPSKS